VATTPIPEPLEPGAGRVRARASDAMARFAQWLAQYSITALRLSLGLVIAGFGALKLIPGASPAEALVMKTTEALTFGAVSGTPAVIITAALEISLGMILLTGRGLRAGLVVMAGWLGAIMAPIMLFPGELFPGGFPTLEAQYVLKDIILAAAWAVIAAQTLGARLIPHGPDDAVVSAPAATHR
jgi:putative oxidoreductase